jgi:aldehyde:ferredoxin oxidoreductase
MFASVRDVGHRSHSRAGKLLLVLPPLDIYDALPPRLTREPLTDGPTQGMVVHLEEMLEEHYHERGWTREGIPTESKLKELGLECLWPESATPNLRQG